MFCLLPVCKWCIMYITREHFVNCDSSFCLQTRSYSDVWSKKQKLNSRCVVGGRESTKSPATCYCNMLQVHSHNTPRVPSHRGRQLLHRAHCRGREERERMDGGRLHYTHTKTLLHNSSLKSPTNDIIWHMIKQWCPCYLIAFHGLHAMSKHLLVSLC